MEEQKIADTGSQSRLIEPLGSSVDFNWFNVSFGKVGSFKLFNLFNRVSTDGHWWGFGVFQYRRRHLFFIGTAGVSVLFIGQTT